MWDFGKQNHCVLRVTTAKTESIVSHAGTLDLPGILNGVSPRRSRQNTVMD
jgi:hypothetical protein